MITVASISELPTTPAVYALYGGLGRARYIAYVGIAKNLRGRIDQHLVKRDSSVTTGTSAACLNPDYVTEVRWWKHKKFRGQAGREAAELVAYDVLDPALRGRGAITNRAKDLYRDDDFYDEMESLFREESRGLLVIPSLKDALQKLTEVEARLKKLEKRQ